MLLAAEGILPALESAHALAGAAAGCRTIRASACLIGLSGRGDKDMPTLSKVIGRDHTIEVAACDATA